MKQLILIFLILFLTTTTQAQVLKQVKKLNSASSSASPLFSEEDAAQAIKEALKNGVSHGVKVLSQKDGYYGNKEVKIPFPQDAKTMEKKLRQVGMGKKVDDVVLSINRASEDAAIAAKDIFIEAIKNMSIVDATKIVMGEKNAATNYLKKTTSEKLYVKFKPIIEKSLQKVNATKYWKDMISTYNKIPMVKKMNPDLTDYVTRKAIKGLFVMIAKEEAKIRIDPIARTSDILKKVFK